MDGRLINPPKADILVVDDTPENLRVLSHMLSHFGYKVRAVTDGALALDVARNSPPDLIMMDVSMPGLDGYETCERLKADDVTCRIPVIFISALDEVDDKVRAFRAGGVDYVTKPFQIEEVLARLDTHLSIRRLQIELEEKNKELAAGLQDLSVAQAAEREQRILAESLRDTIAAINSTLDMNEVLGLILVNLARVAPHDAANIALLDEHGMLHIRGVRGYRERGLEHTLLATVLPLNHYPNWRLVAETRKTVVIPDILQSLTWVSIPEWAWVRSAATTPIITKDELIGLINLDSETAGTFRPEQIGPLQTFANYAAVAIEKARLFERTQQLAITDEVTGLINRRQVLYEAGKEYDRARRYRRPLSAIMIDIDQFKRINDTFGHPVGDRVLRALATCCRANLRTVDVIGRYGGEEFLVLMPETEHDKALEAAERIRRQVEAIRLPTPRGPVGATICLGVATLPVDQELSLEQLIIHADDALYLAKSAGRNRVTGYSK